MRAVLVVLLVAISGCPSPIPAPDTGPGPVDAPERLDTPPTVDVNEPIDSPASFDATAVTDPYEEAALVPLEGMPSDGAGYSVAITRDGDA